MDSRKRPNPLTRFKRAVWFPTDPDAQRKLLQTSSFGVLFVALASVGIAIFWLSWPYAVPSVSEPIEILNEDNEIAIGEPIRMRIEVDKPVDLNPVDTSVFITCTGGNLVTMDGNTRNLPVGEYVVNNESYILPNKILPGSECQFNFRNNYQVNPIKVIQQEWASETFTVLAGDPIGRR